MNIVYKGETLKYIEDFHGEPVLWITNPSQRSMEHMTFVGGYPNEYCIYLKDLPKTDIKDIKSQVTMNMAKDMPISNTLKIHIGMGKDEITNSVNSSDILEISDMNTGYIWLKCWIYPFDDRILCNLCFKNEILIEIDVYPHISNIGENNSWDTASVQNMQKEKELCQKWLSNNKAVIPDSAFVFANERELSTGIIIK